MSLQIEVMYYPNHQFLLWDPFHAEFLRTQCNIAVTGSLNSVTNGEVRHDPSTISQTIPSIISEDNSNIVSHINNSRSFNSNAEQRYSVYKGIGSPPYSIPNFQITTILNMFPQIDTTIYDVITTDLILTSSQYLQYIRPLQMFLLHNPVHSHIDINSSDLHPTVTSLLSHLSNKMRRSQSRQILKLTDFPVTHNLFHLFGFLLSIDLPIAHLYNDLYSRGMYITDGFHYNQSLTVYDPITPSQCYGQSPINPTTLENIDESNIQKPASTTMTTSTTSITKSTLVDSHEKKGDALKFNPLSVTYADYIQSFAVYRALGQTFSRNNSIIDDFNLFLTKKAIYAKMCWDKKNMEREAKLQKIELLKQQGVSKRLLQNQKQQTTTLEPPQSFQPPDFDTQKLLTYNSDEVNKDDNDGIDPIALVHSRWLISFVSFGDHFPRSAPPSPLPRETIIVIADDTPTSHINTGDSAHIKGTITSPFFKNGLQFTSKQNDKLMTVDNTNKNLLNLSENGMDVDLDEFNAIISRNQTITNLYQLAEKQSYTVTTIGHDIQLNAKHQLLSHPMTMPTSVTIHEPTLGYPNTTHSTEILNGCVRLCETLHKKTVLATLTPNCLTQAQIAYTNTIFNYIYNMTTDASDEMLHDGSELHDIHTLDCTDKNTCVQFNRDFQQNFTNAVCETNAMITSVLEQFNSILDITNVTLVDSPPKIDNFDHFSYFTCEFDSAMTVTGLSKKQHLYRPITLPDGLPTTRSAMKKFDYAVVTKK